MPQRQRIQFLPDSVRRLATELGRLLRATRIMMSFLFVENKLLFPTLTVEFDQFQRGAIALVEQVGQQTMRLSMARALRIVQLAVIAAMAGLGEEMIFRGVVQAALANWLGDGAGPWIALLAAAVLFGLLHTVTPTYALLAGLIGLYLGWLWMVTDNLLVPVVVHGLDDFVALVYLVKTRPAIHPPDADGR